jgi:dipeptidyl aminopeptidase/acylaminoacyl peptidase
MKKKATGLFLSLLSLLSLAAASAAGLSDVQTFLGQTAYDEVRLSPDGSRLAFIARRNGFEHDREVFTLWTVDLSHPGAQPVQIAEPVGCSALRWSPDGSGVVLAATGAGQRSQPGRCCSCSRRTPAGARTGLIGYIAAAAASSNA